MTELILFAFLLGGLYVIIEFGCREVPPPAGWSWFSVYPRLRISKKKRTRGEVNREGLSLREQAHR